MGEVVATGDGKYRGGEEKPMWVKPGDVVVYQLGGPQIENSKFKVDGVPLKVFHQGDIIAKLSAKKITKDTFCVIGNWVLLEVKLSQGLILVPEKHAPSEEFKFIVHQKGEAVNIPINVGDQVYPERGRCLPVEIDGITLVYTHQDFIHGVLENGETDVEDTVPTVGG